MKRRSEPRNKNQHVIPHPEGWAVKAAGASRATSVHSTKVAAVEAGIKIAKTQKKDLFIHGRNGRIQDRDSYGNDPYPPRDTKH